VVDEAAVCELVESMRGGGKSPGLVLLV
jgi:hypothetical protein